MNLLFLFDVSCTFEINGDEPGCVGNLKSEDDKKNFFITQEKRNKTEIFNWRGKTKRETKN